MTEEALRYLRVTGEPDAETLADIREAFETFEGRGKFLYRALPRAAAEFESRDLERHLGASGTVILFAATLGAETDALIRGLESVKPAKSLIFDACASAYVEKVCDDACAEIRKEFPYLSERFSPGYGDLPLSFSEFICSTLKTEKHIGLAPLKSHALAPLKSVTAVMGSLGAAHYNRHCGDCSGCDRDCVYRKREKNNG